MRSRSERTWPVAWISVSFAVMVAGPAVSVSLRSRRSETSLPCSSRVTPTQKKRLLGKGMITSTSGSTKKLAMGPGAKSATVVSEAKTKPFTTPSATRRQSPATVGM